MIEIDPNDLSEHITALESLLFGYLKDSNVSPIEAAISISCVHANFLSNLEVDKEYFDHHVKHMKDVFIRCKECRDEIKKGMSKDADKS